jgi:hypothetical protein
MTTDVRELDLFFGHQRTIDGRARRAAKKTGPHLVTILPRGEAIRNFVYSGTLEEVAREVEVSVLSVLPGEEVEDLLHGCSDNVFPLHEIPERRIVNNLRELLDLAHGRWLWSEAARERWRLRDMEASAQRRRTRRLIRKLACYPFANRTGLRLLSRCERRASQRFRTTESYIKLFQELKPSLVFNGSHVHSRVAIQAIQAAQWLKIPTAAFIFSWDNLTSQGRIMPPYDQYLVWNETLRDQLLNIYDTIRPDQVFVTGTPQFDFHFRPEFRWSREEFCAHVGADPARPIVLYSTGMANHMPGEPQFVEGIAAMLREMTDLRSPQLLVRVYPKDQTGRFEQVKRENPDVLFPPIPWEPAWQTPRLEDAPLLTNMLRHAAVGINVASTVSLELCMFDKPVVNVGYNPPGIEISELDYSRYYKFDHYRKVVESGAVRVASSEDELRSMLRRALVEPEVDRSERRALIMSMFGDTLDGYSGLRVADRLIKLAGVRTTLQARSGEREFGLA